MLAGHIAQLLGDGADIFLRPHDAEQIAYVQAGVSIHQRQLPVVPDASKRHIPTASVQHVLHGAAVNTGMINHDGGVLKMLLCGTRQARLRCVTLPIDVPHPAQEHDHGDHVGHAQRVRD